jgi:RNA polymerase sigma-70 factor (ECF subfamily)
MKPNEQNGSRSAADDGQDKQRDMLLVLAACSGDSHAFIELSKPHSKRVLLTLYRITKNWQDAEDALQEALMKAFLHLDSFQVRASFSTWFTKIAVNTALMLLRKRRGVLESVIGKTGGLDSCGEWDLKDCRDNPEQCFERQQRVDLIRSGILQLPAKLRKVVELQYSRDLSNHEIAQCLDISVAATKSRLLRARAALRTFIQREVCESSRKAEHVWIEPRGFPQNGSDGVRALSTRRTINGRSGSRLIGRNLVPVRVLSTPWSEAIHMGDEKLSMIGGK